MRCHVSQNCIKIKCNNNCPSKTGKQQKLSCYDQKEKLFKICHVANSGLDTCVFTETWFNDFDPVTVAALFLMVTALKTQVEKTTDQGGGVGVMVQEYEGS